MSLSAYTLHYKEPLAVDEVQRRPVHAGKPFVLGRGTVDEVQRRPVHAGKPFVLGRGTVDEVQRRPVHAGKPFVLGRGTVDSILINCSLESLKLDVASWLITQAFDLLLEKNSQLTSFHIPIVLFF